MVNWKDVAIGAASTLVVTVVGGVLIYYLTKEPAPKAPTERLVYEVQRSGEFQSTNTKVALQTIRIANLGDAAASHVHAVVEYPSGIEVVDRVASLSSGPAGVLSITAPTPQLLEFSVESLTPAETLTVSVVLNQGVQTLPKVGVKSERSVGTVGELVAQPADEPSRTTSKVDERLLPLLLIAQLPLALYFSRRIMALLRGVGGYRRSLNNAAFLLLHQGYTQEASRLLRRALLQGEAGADEFANRALCLALGGDVDGAARSLAAAELYDRTGHSAAIISFNRALIALLAGDEPTATRHLQAALKTDRKEVVRWANYSSLFQKYSASMNNVRQLLTSSDANAQAPSHS